ncbi:hypothetical protein [Magnetofaba australis]|uniref:Uncharacterized protein n=1 Tax=Magnetofaba australis IT-1 TaxID=1434232 RepID=A0A1Y2K0C2_9PROT|nr:hypothetical protein [Magnetofaba australis]OSM01402.1 hypothetical protein MAIT1_01347 [Magnetofaba australis IT-1]
MMRLLMMLTLLAGLTPGAAQAATPGDVLGVGRAVVQDLEEIRAKLDANANAQEEIPVVGASPREVFYQAESLELKIVDLVKQRAGLDPRPLLLLPPAKITPDHVLAVMQSAHRILGEGKQALGVGAPTRPQKVEKATPTDVYKTLMQANRQINLLLTTKIIPSDVYQRVEESVQIAQILNAAHGDDATLDLPQLDLKKGPGDVYNQMIRCFRIIHQILSLSSVKSMDLETGHEAAQGTTPGDVYDLASLLYSEMAHLYFDLPKRPLTPGVGYPGPKKPGHVYQLAEALEDQLLQLRKNVLQHAVAK